MKKHLFLSLMLFAGLIVLTSFLEKKEVLIIGDSISIGYTPFLQKALAPEINVEHNPGNGGNTKRGVQSIDQWLGGKQWDVIVFNFGLHDLVRIDSLKKYNVVDGKIQVTIEDYKKNLNIIASKLKQTTATLIFVTTTMVPENASGRKGDDVAVYNAAAIEVMKKNGIQVLDLYTSSLTTHPNNSKLGDVHYTEQGYQLLAEPIIKAIKNALK